MKTAARLSTGHLIPPEKKKPGTHVQFVDRLLCLRQRKHAVSRTDARTARAITTLVELPHVVGLS